MIKEAHEKVKQLVSEYNNDKRFYLRKITIKEIYEMFGIAESIPYNHISGRYKTKSPDLESKLKKIMKADVNFIGKARLKAK